MVGLEAVVLKHEPENIEALEGRCEALFELERWEASIADAGGAGDFSGDGATLFSGQLRLQCRFKPRSVT